MTFLLVYGAIFAMVFFAVFGLPRLLDTSWVPEFPLWQVVLGGGAVLVTLCATVILLEANIEQFPSPFGRALVIFTTILLFASACVVSVLFAHSTGGTLSKMIFDSSLKPLPYRNYETAKRFEQDKRFDEAIAEYRLYYLDDLDDPDPLIRAASLAEATGRYDASAMIHGEIAERFPERAHVWAGASLARANLLANHLGDREAANAILEELAARTPELDEGRAAAKILERRKHATTKKD